MVQVRFPTDSDRLAIVGRTGSGKTVAAAWHLSLRDFHKMAWAIINSKGDKLLDKIGRLPGVRNISLDDMPHKTGLHMIRPIPEQDDERLQAFFWRIWERGKTGIYADEGYMMPKGGAFNALLTQGRSKRIPMIILCQRPVWLSKFVFSESDYFQIFELSHSDDQENLRKFVPYKVVEGLPDYYSLWYQVKLKSVITFGPVPDEAEVLQTIREKVQPKTRYV